MLANFVSCLPFCVLFLTRRKKKISPRSWFFIYFQDICSKIFTSILKLTFVLFLRILIYEVSQFSQIDHVASGVNSVGPQADRMANRVNSVCSILRNQRADSFKHRNKKQPLRPEIKTWPQKLQWELLIWKMDWRREMGFLCSHPSSWWSDSGASILLLQVKAVAWAEELWKMRQRR